MQAKTENEFRFGEARTGSQTAYPVSQVSELRFGFVRRKCAQGEDTAGRLERKSLPDFNVSCRCAEAGASCGGYVGVSGFGISKKVGEGT